MAQAESAITNTTSIAWEGYVWRAAVAGAIGAVAFVGLGVIYNWWRYSLNQLGGPLAIAAIIAPFLGLMRGATVGWAIWRIRKQMIVQPDAWFRFLIGMGVAALFELFLGSGVLPRPASLSICVFMGGLPAIAARSSKPPGAREQNLNDDSFTKVTQPATPI